MTSNFSLVLVQPCNYSSCHLVIEVTFIIASISLKTNLKSDELQLLILESTYLDISPSPNLNDIAVTNTKWMTDYKYSEYWLA